MARWLPIPVLPLVVVVVALALVVVVVVPLALVVVVVAILHINSIYFSIIITIRVGWDPSSPANFQQDFNAFSAKQKAEFLLTLMKVLCFKIETSKITSSDFAL